MPLIEIRCADGESFTFDCDESLWNDLQAFSQSTGQAVESVIAAALEQEFRRLASRADSENTLHGGEQ